MDSLRGQLGAVALLVLFGSSCRVASSPMENTFELRGLHAELGCADCHDPTEPLGPLPTDCASCHLEDSPPGHFEPPCEACHDEFGWGTAVDHSFFPLDNAHLLECESCHTDGSFEGLEPACASCHEVDRPSAEHYAGQDCGDCHTPTIWATAVDHGFFPLDGAHALDCVDCHTTAPDFAGLQPACTSCHEPDRPDPGHYLPFECSDCHERTVWADLPDHSFFLLDNSHAISCDSCHTTIPDFVGLSPACASCHESDRPANHFVGQDCSSCHSTGAWTDGADHDFFPLTDNHAVACESCHVTAPIYTGLSPDCGACHEQERPGCHFTGQTCSDCHSITSTWLANAQGINHGVLFGIGVPHRQVAAACDDCHETPNSQCDYNCLDCHNDAPGDHNDVNNFQNTSVACFDCHYN